MSILFLDVDGVLNHAAWFSSMHGRGGIKSDDDMVDPACVARLNTIVERARCAVVISSSWRHRLKTAEIYRMLRRRGYTGRVVGATPTEGQTPGGIFIGCDRGAEIQAWLSANGNPSPICILDDNADMLHLAPLLIQTSFATGLLDEHVERAVKMLGGSNV